MDALFDSSISHCRPCQLHEKEGIVLVDELRVLLAEITNGQLTPMLEKSFDERIVTSVVFKD